MFGWLPSLLLGWFRKVGLVIAVAGAAFLAAFVAGGQSARRREAERRLRAVRRKRETDKKAETQDDETLIERLTRKK